MFFLIIVFNTKKWLLFIWLLHFGPSNHSFTSLFYSFSIDKFNLKFQTSFFPYCCFLLILFANFHPDFYFNSVGCNHLAAFTFTCFSLLEGHVMLFPPKTIVIHRILCNSLCFVAVLQFSFIKNRLLNVIRCCLLLGKIWILPLKVLIQRLWQILLHCCLCCCYPYPGRKIHLTQQRQSKKSMTLL